MANRNEFKVDRVAAYLDVPFAQAAATFDSGIIIPAGAIITGVKAVVTGAQTNLTDASATFRLRVGTDNIISAQTLKQLGAQTIPVALTLNQAGGVYVPNSGALNVILQASANSSYVGYPSFYVEYFV